MHLHKPRISAGSALVREFHGSFESVGDPEPAETVRSVVLLAGSRFAPEEPSSFPGHCHVPGVAVHTLLSG